jgi:hypothetical protein
MNDQEAVMCRQPADFMWVQHWCGHKYLYTKRENSCEVAAFDLYRIAGTLYARVCVDLHTPQSIAGAPGVHFGAPAPPCTECWFAADPRIYYAPSDWIVVLHHNTIMDS